MCVNEFLQDLCYTYIANLENSGEAAVKFAHYLYYRLYCYI